MLARTLTVSISHRSSHAFIPQAKRVLDLYIDLHMNVKPTRAGRVHATTFPVVAAAWHETPVLLPMDRIQIVVAVTATPFCLYFLQLYDSSVS